MTDYRQGYPDPQGSGSADEPMFAGPLSFCRRPYGGDAAGADVAVIGVPLDSSVSGRPGTRLGPRAIRAASTNLAWSRHWPSPFDPFARMRVIDWGDVALRIGHPADNPARIEGAVGQVIGTGARALLLGGDHFIAYPSLRAHTARHGPLGLIQIDAHTDTWEGDGWEEAPGKTEDGAPRAMTDIDHGTMFYHAVREGLIDPDRSIQVGIRTTNDAPLGIEIRDAITVHDTPLRETIAAIRARATGPCYLSFDIDGLDPAFAPGTGTPVVGGLSTHQALSILRGLAGLDIRGADVVEVSPPFDVAEITALAGATIALQILCLFAEAPPC
ncbi:MAG: agmatinase [Pseudomonadota bacterium]